MAWTSFAAASVTLIHLDAIYALLLSVPSRPKIAILSGIAEPGNDPATRFISSLLAVTRMFSMYMSFSILICSNASNANVASKELNNFASVVRKVTLALLSIVIYSNLFPDA